MSYKSIKIKEDDYNKLKEYAYQNNSKIVLVLSMLVGRLIEEDTINYITKVKPEVKEIVSAPAVKINLPTPKVEKNKIIVADGKVVLPSSANI